MPAFEELPDDAADKPTVNSFGSRVEASQKVSSSAAASSSNSIQRGFFDKKPKPAAKARPSEEAPSESSSKPPIAGSAGSSSSNAAREAEPADAPGCGPDALAAAELAQGLRKRLQGAVDEATTSRRASQRSRLAQQREADSTAHSAVVDEITTALNSAKAELGKWPTSASREAREKATSEAGSALAELRSAQNDARRLRGTGGGDTAKAVGELKRATEEATERVRKAVDAVVPKDSSEEDASNRVASAFHTLPFSAKLRMLADEPVALSAVVVSFSTGAAIMLGILAEVYTAWGCAFQCQR